MHVVCAGLATVDLVQRVERLPGPAEKAEALAADAAADGPATNAAITVAALGATVTLVTAVGAHPLGGLIRANLDTYGVRLLDAAPLSITPPPVSAVTVLAAGGRRTIVSRNAGDRRAAVPPGLAVILATADTAQQVEDARLQPLLVDGHHLLLARAAVDSGRPLLLDAGSWRPALPRTLTLPALPRGSLPAT